MADLVSIKIDGRFPIDTVRKKVPCSIFGRFPIDVRLPNPPWFAGFRLKPEPSVRFRFYVRYDAHTLTYTSWDYKFDVGGKLLTECPPLPLRVP